MNTVIQFPVTQPKPVQVVRSSVMQNQKKGFAVFTRSLLSAEWAKDAFMLSAWLRLVMKACHADCDLYFNGQNWELKRGQLVLVPARFADELCDRKGSALSRQAVVRILDWFESNGMIERAGYDKGTVITIINYDPYQSIERLIQPGQLPEQLPGQPTGHLNPSAGAGLQGGAGQPTGQLPEHLPGSEEQPLITTINNNQKDQEQNISDAGSPSAEPAPGKVDVIPKKQALIPPDAAIYSDATKTPRWGTKEDLITAEWFIKIRGQAFVCKGLTPPKEQPLVNIANEIRLMRVHDKRSHHDICELFVWVCKTGRELEYCQSPAKLRDKWDQLQLKKANAERNVPYRENRLGNVAQAQAQAQAIMAAGAGGYDDDTIL